MRIYDWDRKIYWDAWSELYEKRIEEMRKAKEASVEGDGKAQSSKSQPVRMVPRRASK